MLVAYVAVASDPAGLRWVLQARLSVGLPGVMRVSRIEGLDQWPRIAGGTFNSR